MLLDQNSAFFTHMPNACLSCVASFEFLHQILQQELWRHQITRVGYGQNMYVILRGYNSAIMT